MTVWKIFVAQLEQLYRCFLHTYSTKKGKCTAMKAAARKLAVYYYIVSKNILRRMARILKNLRTRINEI